MLAREVIAKAVRRAGWIVSVETPGTSGGGDGWTLDVLANREGGKPVAFKLQWGRLPLDEVSRFQAGLQAAGIRTLWLMRQQSIPVEKATPDRWASHLEDREAIDKWWFDDRPGEGTVEDFPLI